MPQFIEGPPITAENINLGVPSRSPGGTGTEIHYDSSAMRAAYERTNGAMSPAAEVMPPMPGMAGPNVELPVDMGQLDPDVLRALAAGQPPPPNKMPPPMSITTPYHQLPASPAPTLAGQTTMLLPLGGGVTAQVVFLGNPPKSCHWKRLIKHMQIEAEEQEGEQAQADKDREAEAFFQKVMAVPAFREAMAYPNPLERQVEETTSVEPKTRRRRRNEPEQPPSEEQ